MSRSSDWVPSLWMDTFDELLEDDELDYGDEWSLRFNYGLTDKVTKEERKRGWKIYSLCAHGTFQCASCKKTWSSARVVLLFHYRLRSDRGTVIMRPFGQACRTCQNNTFRLPGFSTTQVEEALLKLIRKIRKNCYGDDDYADNDSGSTEVPMRNRKPHEASLCEACIMGIFCKEAD
ncbi:receptor-transporting protein 3-like [Enoplosus armatus]|uniref:receptor-transporting protein 3-like n=1 Tax=Enoplosus armatus TaxID=215367 RepID=UPI003994A7E3